MAVKKDDKRDSMSQKKVKCYNCGELGHYSTMCLEKSLYCCEELMQQATRKGVVEGKDRLILILFWIQVAL